MVRRAGFRGWALWLSLWAAGCGFDGSALEERRCLDDLDCAAPWRCLGGFCQEGRPRDDLTGACASDADCDDGVFCDGVEVCDPAHPSADARGCAPGAPPEVDDGLACTVDLCDALKDAVVHIATGDCCASDDDCAALLNPGLCERAACDPDRGACALELAVGAPCDDNISCTINDLCDASGACAGAPDDLRCDNGEACDGAEVCDPASGCAAGEGEDGLACSPACGEEGVCEGGACVAVAQPVAREGGWGEPGCADGVDNDCDGGADGEDADCLRPDALALEAPAQAPAGQPVTVTVRARAQGRAASPEAASLACEAWRLRAALGLEEAGAGEGASWRAVGADGAALAPESPLVQVGARWDARDAQSPRGVRLCGGASLELGPWVMPPLAPAPVRTLVFAVRWGSPPEGGLAPGEVGVLATATVSPAPTSFRPFAALEASGEELSEVMIALRNGGGVNRATLRVGAVSLAGGVQGCVFVDEIKVYEVENPGQTAAFVEASWAQEAGPRAAVEEFERLDAAALAALLSPGEGDEVWLSADARTSGGKGLAWTAQGEAALTFPPLLAPPPGVAAGAPLWLELNLGLPEVDRGEAGPVALEWSPDEGRSWRALGGALPERGLPAWLQGAAAFRIRYNDRAQVPIRAWERAGGGERLRLRWSSPSPGAAAWLDTLRLRHYQDAAASVSTPGPVIERAPGVFEVPLRATAPGLVEISCGWRAPGAAPVVGAARVEFQ